MFTDSGFERNHCYPFEQTLWEWGTEPESNAVTTLVRRLRKCLDTIGAQDSIETVYGMGYRLNTIDEVSNDC
ncbi:MAG: helix-turn-helix domain-containing protein [Halothece sp.]